VRGKPKIVDRELPCFVLYSFREGAMLKNIFLFSLCVLLMAACTPAARSDLVVEEHLLSGPPDISTDELVFHFAQGDQAAILARTASYKDYFDQWKEYNARLLEPFGYELKTRQTPEGGTIIDIYLGNQPVGEDVITLRPVSVNASKTNFVALADLSDGTYLFSRGVFAVRDWFVGRQPYGYVGDQLLSLELKHMSDTVSQVDVYLDNKAVYHKQFNAVSVYGFYDGPWTYGEHWALVLLDSTPDGQQGWNPYTRLIQDGQDVSEANGYQQAFNFAMLDGKPFYFYQKADKIGISFDGKEIAPGYDEIPHYQCCSGSLLNPATSMKMAWFFARRGNDWYYVEAYIPGAMPQ
jgi:hypothetical protein